MGRNTKEFQIVLNELFKFSKKSNITFLTHYTSLNALTNILGESEIHFSNCYYLNDAKEITHGLEIIDSIANKRKIQIQNSAPEFNKLGGYLDKLVKLVKALRDDESAPKFYIFCLCEKRDLLSQWRGYSKDSCPIGIKFKISGIGPSPSSRQKFYLLKIIYNEKKQFGLITRIIDSYLKKCSKKNADLDKILFDTLQALIISIVFFKKHVFKEEEEWRFLYFYFPSLKKSKKVKFKNCPKYVLPYVVFKFKELFPISNDCPINEIIIGPQRHQLTEPSLIEYLKSNKLKIPITCSDIPYRT